MLSRIHKILKLTFYPQRMALFSRLPLSSPGLLTPEAELKVGDRESCSELGGEVRGELEEWPGSGLEPESGVLGGSPGERSPGWDSESLNL